MQISNTSQQLIDTSFYSAGLPKVSLESIGIQLESFDFRWIANGICPKRAETAVQRLFDRKTMFPLDIHPMTLRLTVLSEVEELNLFNLKYEVI